jgi:hypothetical protein
MPEMGLQVAFWGHWLDWLGSQMRAQLVGVDEPWVSRTHSGEAVVPSGRSVGQAWEGEQ